MKKQKWYHWTVEEKRATGKEIKALIDQGLSMRQICIKLDITWKIFKDIMELCNLKYKKGSRAKYWTNEKYYELYVKIEPFLQMGWPYRKIAREICYNDSASMAMIISTVAKMFTSKKSKESIEKELKQIKSQSIGVGDGHSIELDSKMGWRKFNVEVRLLSCPVDKFKYRIVKCSAIQELYEYLDYFCPLNEFIISFGDKKNEMFVFIDDIKRPLDQQTIFKLFY